MKTHHLTVLVSLSLLWGALAAVNVSVPLVPPSTSQTLSSTLISFSIEADHWPDWTGVKHRNEFIFNALDNYARLTGQPPKLRVGADAVDFTTWSPDIDIIEATFPPPSTTTPYPGTSAVLVGDGFYELVKFLPPGTVMTWDVNFGDNNVTNAVNMAKSIAKAFASPAVKESKVTLGMIEIGNEVDVYAFTGHRGSDWSLEEYLSQWKANADPIVEAVDMKQGGVTFQGGPFVANVWHPEQVFEGLSNSTSGSLITTFAQHLYSVTKNPQTGDAALSSFLTKANIRGNLTMWRDDIAATKQRGLHYVLGETGSCAFGGVAGISNTAGAALWVIDYALQAATLGIEEVFFHQSIGAKYDFMVPIALNRSIIDNSPLDPPEPPHVTPSYYAGILVNSLIGNSGSAKVTELPVPDENVSGYAVYEGNTLKRAVFVNLHAWLLSSTGVRPSVHINLLFSRDSGFGGTKATAKRLLLNHADDLDNLTFAGQSFETRDARPTGKIVEEEIDLAEGLDIQSTEAILISF